MKFRSTILISALYIAFINFTSCAESKKKENILVRQSINDKELIYLTPTGESVAFFGHVGSSEQNSLSCWRGLKVKSKNSDTITVIDPKENMYLIADLPKDINNPKVVTWSQDYEVILFHIVLPQDEKNIALDKVNTSNCVENPLLGVDIKGLSIAHYGERVDTDLNVTSYNTCKGSLGKYGHNFEMDVLDKNNNYQTKELKLIRDLFFIDYNRVETETAKGNKGIVSDVFNLPLINSYLELFPINGLNVTPYNNLGYYLEQNKSFKEASILLAKIIAKFPDRTVAYVNLGDAYWGLKDTSKAKTAYQKYIELMKKSGKEAKIPKRVLERVK